MSNQTKIQRQIGTDLPEVKQQIETETNHLNQESITTQQSNKINNYAEKKRGRGRPKKTSQGTPTPIKVKQEETKTILAKLQESKYVRVKQQQCKREANIIKDLQLNPANEDDTDLCTALVYLKKSLPRRSIDRLITKLYQNVQHQRRQKQMKETTTSVSNKGNKHDSEVSRQDNQSVFSQQKQISQNSSVCSDKVSNHSFKDNSSTRQKLILPGRKSSCYHDKVGGIAAFSHQYYKTNPPTMEQLVQIKKNLSGQAVYIKPIPDSVAAIPEILKQQSAINHTTKQSLFFHFKVANTLKTKFLSNEEKKKYDAKRQLGKLYIQRGYGLTKKIDEDLPPMQMDRVRFKNKLVCILTQAFRKLETFLVNDLKRTISYLNHDQLKVISIKLLNCRFQLQPNHCQTYLKFVKISMALQDVSVCQQQAIDLYIGLQRHLQGKNVTMQMLERKGKIKSSREVTRTLEYLTMRAERQKYKSMSYAPENNRMHVEGSQNQNGNDFYYDDGRSNSGQIWSFDKLQELIDLFTQGLQLKQIHAKLVNTYAQLANKSESDIQDKIANLIEEGLIKLQNSSKLLLHNGPFLNLNREAIDLIKKASNHKYMQCFILNFLISLDPTQRIVQLINTVNQFLSKNMKIVPKVNFMIPQPYIMNQNYKPKSQRSPMLDQMIDLKSNHSIQAVNGKKNKYKSLQNKNHIMDQEYYINQTNQKETENIDPYILDNIA